MYLWYNEHGHTYLQNYIYHYILFLINYLFFSFIFISWRLITLQYCSGFCHTLTWISHGFTCIPYPDPPSHLPLYLILLGLPSAPGLSSCLMHPTWAGRLAFILLFSQLQISYLSIMCVENGSSNSPWLTDCILSYPICILLCLTLLRFHGL